MRIFSNEPWSFFRTAWLGFRSSFHDFCVNFFYDIPRFFPRFGNSVEPCDPDVLFIRRNFVIISVIAENLIGRFVIAAWSKESLKHKSKSPKNFVAIPNFFKIPHGIKKQIKIIILTPGGLPLGPALGCFSEVSIRKIKIPRVSNRIIQIWKSKVWPLFEFSSKQAVRALRLIFFLAFRKKYPRCSNKSVVKVLGQNVYESP